MKALLDTLVSAPAGVFLVLVIAAALEVFGDACFQSGMYHASGVARWTWLAGGVVVLALYSGFVNLPRWDFGKLLGVYVVLFFLVAQVVAKLRFHQDPTKPVWVGGALIVLGGAVMTCWKQ